MGGWMKEWMEGGVRAVKIVSHEKTWALDGWMGWWVGGKAGLRIAYSNQKL